jgi:hypothetical protein
MGNPTSPIEQPQQPATADSLLPVLMLQVQKLTAAVEGLQDEVRQLRAATVRADSPTLTLDEAETKLGCKRTKLNELVRIGKVVRVKGPGREGLVTTESVEKLRQGDIPAPRQAPKRKPARSPEQEAAAILRLPVDRRDGRGG